MPNLIHKPRYIALDTSHIAQWVRDRSSGEPGRAAARGFERWLEQSGYVPLLCLHHLEELAKHDNESVVLGRLRFIGGLKFVAWIANAGGADRSTGTIVSLLAEEAKAALESPGQSVIQVRDRAMARLVHVGTGEDILGPDPDIWLAMQPAFLENAAKAREVMALARSSVVDISDMKMSALMNGRVSPGDEIERRLDLMARTFAADIARRGDQRISDPGEMANRFMGSVRELAQPVPDGAAELVLRSLACQGVCADDIGPESTVGEMLDLGMFRSQLRIVGPAIGASPAALATLRMDQLPSWSISRALERHAQELPERKGSECNDAHLACLSAYADVTFVDKRTLENFRRALRKDKLLARLARRVERASSYRDIPSILTEGEPVGLAGER